MVAAITVRTGQKSNVGIGFLETDRTGRAVGTMPVLGTLDPLKQLVAAV